MQYPKKITLYETYPFCKIAIGVLLTPVILWFVLFEWKFVPYPTDSAFGSITCYSPNHEYYIKRYQTPFAAIQDQLYAKGVAILYDKTDKELYRGYTYLFDIKWFSDSVAIFGSGGWYFQLPSSPGYGETGNHSNGNSCFDEISHLEFPPMEYDPNFYRDLIIKTVEPLKKTKTPYQFQFLIEDQNGVPFFPYYYMIIRADGSRKRGETDEKGRTFVIESALDESISLYISPCQTAECFMPPEELEGWCSRSPKECSRPEDYTFTVSTAKVEGKTTVIWDGSNAVPVKK